MSIAHLLRRAGPEAQECAAWCEWFQHRYPALWPVLVHIPNERKGRVAGTILRALGVKPGVPDYLLPVPIGGYIGMWLEFKAAGRTWHTVSAHQRAWLDAMRDLGYFTGVAYGVDHAIAATTAYVEQRDLGEFWHGPRPRARRKRG